MKAVHIGMHKTGTTYLQKYVFPYFKDIKYYDYYACAEVFKGILTGQLPKNKLENGLYSFEGLCGQIGTGIGRYERMMGLKEMGADKIIITTRDTEALKKSVYKQFIAEGGTLTFKSWLNSKYYNESYFDDQSLIDNYKRVFGEKSVLVITQENIKNIIPFVLIAFKDFLNLSGTGTPNNHKSANISLSDTSNKILRIMNHFTNSHHRQSSYIPKWVSTNNVKGLLLKIERKL